VLLKGAELFSSQSDETEVGAGARVTGISFVVSCLYGVGVVAFSVFTSCCDGDEPGLSCSGGGGGEAASAGVGFVDGCATAVEVFGAENPPSLVGLTASGFFSGSA
jgi:hypothetical protein